MSRTREGEGNDLLAMTLLGPHIRSRIPQVSGDELRDLMVERLSLPSSTKQTALIDK